MGLLMIGLMLSYPHMLPFVGGVAFVWRIFGGLQSRSWAWLTGWFLRCITGGMICGLIIPNRILAFYVWIKQAASDQSGWTIRVLWPDHLLGLIGTQMDRVHVALPQTNIRIAVLVSVAVFLLYRLFFCSKKGRTQLISAMAGLSVIYACALYFAFTDGGEIFGSYKAFKLLSYFGALWVIIVAASWIVIWKNGTGGRICAALFLAGYVTAWGAGIVAIVRGDGLGNHLTSESEKLIALDREGGFPSVNIVTENYWVSMWLTYFFLDKQVYPAYRTYYPPASLNGQVSFAGGIGDGSNLVIIKGDASLKTAFNLDYFPVTRRITCHLGQGWHGPENEHEWMGANGREAEIVIFAFGELREITAVIHLLPFLQANTYSAQWNNIQVATDVTADTFTLQLGNVKPGRNVLRLISKLPPKAPGHGDPRPICFGLRRLELSISN